MLPACNTSSYQWIFTGPAGAGWRACVCRWVQSLLLAVALSPRISALSRLDETIMIIGRGWRRPGVETVLPTPHLQAINKSYWEDIGGRKMQWSGGIT